MPPTSSSRATSSSDSARLAHRNRAIVLHVSSAGFQYVWAAILVLRCVCAGYLGGISSVYYFLSNPAMAYYTSLLGPHASSQLIPMATCSAVLAVAHLYKAAVMLVCSWQCRQPVFERTVSGTKVQPLATHLGRLRRSTSIEGVSVLRFRRVRTVARRVCRVWRKLFGWNGFFSVKGDFFDIRLLSREFFEILSQTLQLMTASQLIVRPWLTSLSAVIVVINCWSTPVLMSLCQRKIRQIQTSRQVSTGSTIDGVPSNARKRASADFDVRIQSIVALERISCLAIDLVLDLIMCVVVPTIILVPYLRQFDLSTFDFPMSILYDDVKFVNLVYELQHVLAVNPFEIIFTLFPHWSIFMCCDSLRVLMSCGKSKPSSHPRMSDKNPIDPSQSILTTTPEVKTNEASEPRQVKSITQEATRGRVKPTATTRFRGVVACARHAPQSSLSHFVFLAWGVVVLSLHLSALRNAEKNVQNRPIGCKQVLQPWITSSCACTVLEYNCFVRNTSTPTDDELGVLHRDSLAVLIFSHCDSVIVPRGIQDFPNLLGFEIYNSTIAHWNLSAALSVDRQKRLSYVQLLRTNMTSLPAGLMAELPPKLLDIEIIGGNLSSLPSELDQLWHPLTVLYLEECGFATFPEVLTRLRVEYLSLAGNQITRLTVPEQPSHSHLDASFVSLSLARNPLIELPHSPVVVGNVNKLRFLSLEGTTVSSIPQWVFYAARGGLKVYLRSSQFCANLRGSSAEDGFGPNAAISCVDEDNHNGVPIGIIAEHRPLVPASWL